MDVAQVRGQFPVTQDTIYMNTGWSGPSPSPVVAAIKERLDLELRQGPTTPPVMEAGRQVQTDAREAFSSLLGVSADEITLTQNTTEGLNIVINGIDWRPGDQVITYGPEHSSVLIPAYFLGGRQGVTVKVVPLASNEAPESILEKTEAAITDRTRLLFFSHVQYTSGLRMPAEGLRELTRRRGVWMLLDGAQTAGHIALDLRALGCEFYSVAGHKWLLGPDGVGALYIREDMIPQVTPRKVSGRAAPSHDDHGSFEPETASIRKFELTTTSVALWAGLAEAVRFHQAIGSEAVEARAVELAAHAKGALSDIGAVTVHSPLEGPGCTGLVSFSVRGWEPADVTKALWEEDRVVSRQVRELGAVRLSLHLFNTEDEVDQVVAAVRGLAARA
jgi:selenocysteine lyase/cysteine desulfurase